MEIMQKNFKLHYEIGQRIKIFRKYSKISQKQLASELDVSFQQFQKYESGENRISAVGLWKISCFLKVDIENFLSENSSKNYINDSQTLIFLRTYFKLQPRSKILLLQFLETII